MKKKLWLLAAACLGLTLAFSQSPVGVWKTIDEKTKEAKSHVEIYQSGNKVFGKVVKLLKHKPDRKCTECEGALKDKPVLGMVILENLAANKNIWKNGSILDPENGKTYGCSIWFEPGKPDELSVRGKHWTGLYRTQTWHRVK